MEVSLTQDLSVCEHVIGQSFQYVRNILIYWNPLK